MHGAFSSCYLKHQFLISPGCVFPDRSQHWGDLQHMSLLPRDTGCGGEHLCAPHSPVQLMAGRSWVAQSSPPSHNRPAHGTAMVSPPQLSPVLLAELFSELLQATSHRCEQRLPDCDGTPWRFTRQSLDVAGLLQPSCPSHCDSTQLTPAILQILITLLSPPRRLPEALWGHSAPPSQREDSLPWGWDGTGSGELLCKRSAAQQG